VRELVLMRAGLRPALQEQSKKYLSEYLYFINFFIFSGSGTTSVTAFKLQQYPFFRPLY